MPKSYNVQKAFKKNNLSTITPESSSKTASSSGTMTLKKKEKIKSVNNKESPEYHKKSHPKKTVTTWKKNETFTPKKETAKLAKTNPHKKLERK